jgi:hypothetical protein
MLELNAAAGRRLLQNSNLVGREMDAPGKNHEAAHRLLHPRSLGSLVGVFGLRRRPGNAGSTDFQFP